MQIFDNVIYFGKTYKITGNTLNLHYYILNRHNTLKSIISGLEEGKFYARPEFPNLPEQMAEEAKKLKVEIAEVQKAFYAAMDAGEGVVQV